MTTLMDNQHPLTDDVGRAIEEDLDLDWAMDCDEYMCMRAGADWQLRRVIDWLKTNIEDYVLEDYYSTYFLPEAFFNDFKKAMRPTTQEENND
jgi:hypothetical protein